MKKLAFTFVVLGSGLAALGFSGWQATGHPGFVLAGASGLAWDFWAGWTPLGQIEITVGVVLLVWGLLLRRDSATQCTVANNHKVANDQQSRLDQQSRFQRSRSEQE